MPGRKVHRSRPRTSPFGEGTGGPPGHQPLLFLCLYVTTPSSLTCLGPPRRPRYLLPMRRGVVQIDEHSSAPLDPTPHPGASGCRGPSLPDSEGAAYSRLTWELVDCESLTWLMTWLL